MQEHVNTIMYTYVHVIQSDSLRMKKEVTQLPSTVRLLPCVHCKHTN